MRAFRADRTEEDSLFAFNLRDLLPEDSDVFLFCELVQEIDTVRFDAVYSDVGEKPIDPRLMLRTILYGLCNGIVSGYKLEAACRYDNRFIVLSGDQRPDRRTFDRFFGRHAESMPQFFRDVVRLAQACDLVELGRLAIDGTKMKANTSKHKAMSYDYMIKAVEKLEEELATRPLDSGWGRVSRVRWLVRDRRGGRKQRLAAYPPESPGWHRNTRAARAGGDGECNAGGDYNRPRFRILNVED